MQFADVMLNKPFKNYMSRRYTHWMMAKMEEETEKGTPLQQIKFNELATEAAGPALGWMVGHMIGWVSSIMCMASHPSGM